MPANKTVPRTTDVLVVGAGPAGSAAAAWAARTGKSVLLADSATFPRDKTCGDGLTPRAIAELDELGLGEWVRSRGVSKGLRLAGFGREVTLSWPDGAFPALGSAIPRTDLDDKLRRHALEQGASMLEGAKAVDVSRLGDRVSSVHFTTADGPREVRCQKLIVADGVKSGLGKALGRVWHRNHAYGIAVRAYIKSGRSDDPYITSHLELRDQARKLQPGYGWVFPLSTGEINIGVGYLATDKRPAKVALRPLLDLYTAQRRDEWELEGDLRSVASALLPMGGAVSNVAGANWVLIGDAAACVNPLNGEGIDYGLEGGRLVSELLDEPDLTEIWPDVLRKHYGAAFSAARRMAAIATIPGSVRAGGPVVSRSHRLQEIALRVMGNLITKEDQDYVARVWRKFGNASLRLDRRIPFS